MKILNVQLYILSLFFLASCSSSTELPCVYIPISSQQNPYPELTQFNNCGFIKNSHITISNKHLKNIWFEDGLSELRIHDGVYYINKASKLVRVHYYDNGADPFKEGLARTIDKNKFGFINKQLSLVIPHKYDFAFPFINGRSLVCNGCTQRPDGEHKNIGGGKWGYIDKHGNEIIEIKLNRKHAEIIKHSQEK